MTPAARDLIYFTRWRAAGCTLVALAVIVSLLPGIPTFKVPYSDKVFHAFTYFLLMGWFTGIYTRKRYPLLAVALAAVGVMVEFAQSMVPYRYFDRYDIAANIAGIVIGWVAALMGLEFWCQTVENRLRK